MLDSAQVTHVFPRHEQSLPADGVSKQLRDAFAQPLDYPPLASATVPGDRVALTIEYGTPCPAEVLQGAVAALRDAGAESSTATLLLAPGFSQEPKLLEQVTQLAEAQGILLSVHDPDDELGLTTVGVTKAGRPLRLNRALANADLVLPVGVCTLESATQDLCAAFGGLFPAFSDRETIRKYYAPIAGDSKVIRAERRAEIDETGWLLGVGLTVLVVPDPTDGIAAVSVGQARAATEDATRQYRKIWACDVKHRADLVVASVSGDVTQHSWQIVGRALETAERVLKPGGSIAICCDLAQLPGPSLLRLAGGEDSPGLERELMRDRCPDSWTALRLSRALDRGTVYFQSRLEPTIVESLGMTPFATEAELSRLISRAGCCVVLDGAQRLLVTVD